MAASGGDFRSQTELSVLLRVKLWRSDGISFCFWKCEFNEDFSLFLLLSLCISPESDATRENEQIGIIWLGSIFVQFLWSCEIPPFYVPQQFQGLVVSILFAVGRRGGGGKPT